MSQNRRNKAKNKSKLKPRNSDNPGRISQSECHNKGAVKTVPFIFPKLQQLENKLYIYFNTIICIGQLAENITGLELKLETLTVTTFVDDT